MAQPTPTRVDFYLVSGSDERVDQVACRLAEKVYQSGQTAFVRVQDSAAARRIDDRLWSFRDDSFVPHRIAARGQEDLAIVIGDGESPPARQVLINLSPHDEPAPERFQRIAEVFSAADEQARTRARERYRLYRERGFELHNHKL